MIHYNFNHDCFNEKIENFLQAKEPKTKRNILLEHKQSLIYKSETRKLNQYSSNNLLPKAKMRN